MGRPSKFDEDTRNKILTALRGGNYRSVAAQYAGVSVTTLRNWLLLAKDPHAPPEYVEFLAAVEKAEADAEVADLALIRRAASDGTWAAAAWIRERKNPERWGKKDRTDVTLTGTDGGPVDVRVSVGADTAAIASLAAVLAGRFAERQDPLAPAIDASGRDALPPESYEAHKLAPGELGTFQPSLTPLKRHEDVTDENSGQSEASGFDDLDEFHERKAEQAAFEDLTEPLEGLGEVFVDADESFDEIVEDLEADPGWDWQAEIDDGDGWWGQDEDI